MRGRIFTFGVTVLVVAFASAGQVTKLSSRGTRADRPLKIPTTAELVSSGSKTGISTAAEVIGMVRGYDRSTTDFNTLEFTATGTMAEPGGGGQWNQYKITKLVVGMDFVLPAIRFDVRFITPDGKTGHQIRVASGA